MVYFICDNTSSQWLFKQLKEYVYLLGGSLPLLFLSILLTAMFPKTMCREPLVWNALNQRHQLLPVLPFPQKGKKYKKRKLNQPSSQQKSALGLYQRALKSFGVLTHVQKYAD